MNKKRFRTMILLAALFVSAGVRAGFVPEYINYEGTVLDEFGQPGVGSRELIFTLVDTNNYSRWQELHPAVRLDSQGAFQVLLGIIHDLPPLEPSWRMTVELFNRGGARTPVTPPQSMTSVFYAMQAGDARKAPGDLSVSEELRVEGELKVTGLLSASRLNVEEVTVGTARVSRLSASELSGKASAPITVESNMELAKGLTVKGSVSMMKVLDFNYSTITNLSGRYYLQAIPVNNLNLDRIVVTSSGDQIWYYSNMPGGIYFLSLDLNPGDRIQFYDKRGDEIPVGSWLFTQLFRTIKLIQMHL
jgi:hypothetical protein